MDQVGVPSQRSREARPIRVLLAEDDDELRTLLASCLERRGYVVTQANHGLDLLRRVERWLIEGTEEPPDVMVTDVRMRGVTGISVLAGLRQLGCDIPVIVMTAFGDPSLHAEARRLGARRLLDKPFDAQLLYDALREATEASPL